MALLIRLLILLAIFTATILLVLASAKLERWLPGYRPFWSALIGSVFAAALYLLVARIHKMRQSFAVKEVFRLKSSLIGVAIAIIAFNFSFAAYSFTHKINFGGIEFQNLMAQFLYEVRPAALEEIGFRFGLALFAFTYFGLTAGIVAGSIPFGLAHLMNFLTGEPVVWSYILGTTAAGAFLSLVFFRYGLMAAILCHYTWNVLAAVAARSFSFQQTAFEGSTATLLIFILLSLGMWLQLRKLV